jgi:6-phosphofructokinase 1
LIALYNDDDAEKSEGRIILRTETVSETYTTDVNLQYSQGRRPQRL